MSQLILDEANKFFNQVMKQPITDKNKFFRMSYSTFARTLKNISKDEYKNEAKKQLEDNVFNFFSTVNRENYNQAIKEFITSSVQIHKLFKIGHTQKLVNILMKYFYVIKLISDNNRNYTNYLDFAREVFPAVDDDDFFKIVHIPVDNIVLNKLSKMNHFFDIKMYTPWSKIDDWKTYINFQEYVKDISSVQDISPIDFELTVLWERK